MINTQYINLNMIPSGVMPVLYCSQYDVGRPLGMVVYNGGEAVDLDTYTCTIEATRTDGTAITSAVTTSDNIGVFVTTATMTNQADQYPAKLVLFDSNSRRVASLAFVMVVTPKTMDENAESIEEDASLYQQYTGTVQTLIADIRTQLTDLNNQTAELYTMLLNGTLEIVENHAALLESTKDNVFVLNDDSHYGSGDRVLYVKTEQALSPNMELTRADGSIVMPLPRRGTITGNAPMEQIGEVIASYINHREFTYGSSGAFDTTCGNYIDCSTFMQLVIQGIPYEKSRYNGLASNIPGRYIGANIFRGGSLYTDGRPYGLLTHEIAMFFAEQNRLFYIDYSKPHPCSQLQPGDVIFECDPSGSLAPTAQDKYLYTHHCAVVMQTYPESDVVVVAQAGTIHAGNLYTQMQGSDNGTSFIRNTCKITTVRIASPSNTTVNHWMVYARPDYAQMDGINPKSMINEAATYEHTVTPTGEAQILATVRLAYEMKKDKAYTLVVEGNLPNYDEDGFFLNLNTNVSNASEVSYRLSSPRCSYMRNRSRLSFSFVPGEDIARMTDMLLNTSREGTTPSTSHTYRVDRIGIFEGIVPGAVADTEWLENALTINSVLSAPTTKIVTKKDGRLRIRITATIVNPPQVGAMTEIGQISTEVLPKGYGTYDGVCFIAESAKEYLINGSTGILSANISADDADKRLIMDIRI